MLNKCNFNKSNMSVKLILSNQYNILSKLAKLEGNLHESESFSQLSDDLYEGRSRFYSHIFENIQTVSSHVDKYVFSILEAHEKENRQFRGFDGNTESEYLNYANSIFEHKLYVSIKPNDCNSHCPMYSTYEKEYGIVLDKDLGC